jgi:glycosyltransferase involved in cell wall biosynthesis
MVSTFYDLQVEAYPAFFPDAVRSERRYHFDQMAAKATSIAAISEFSREVAIGHGVAADRIVAIPIQLAQHRQGSAVADPPFQLEAGRYLLYPANFWRHKNHELLFTAFAMARQQGLDPGIQLVCTGDGVDRLDLLCHLRDGLGLSSSLILPGFVSNCELEALLQHCLALVFPSLYEGFGMPVIEAMARGIPVACSSSTSLGEVAGDAAILFDPRNPQQISTAMLTMASLSPGQRQELVEKGLRQSQQYQDSARMADQYWELFHAAMNPC